MSKVWLITGSASGLGRTIAEAVLAAGDRLVATARDPQLLADLVERYGDRVRTAALDVTDAQAAQAAAQVALDHFGRIDVLVNNAGFGHLAPFEQADEADFRAQIDTNFYGVVHMTRAVVPTMRQQRSGHIIQISSVGGRIGTPGMSAYQAAKWAVGGFSEVLNMELAPLGIKVCVLEPGGMRTGWVRRAGSRVPAILPDYAPTVGALADMLGAYAGHETGDPVKVAEIVLELAHHDQPPLHLLLGSDAVQFAGDADAARAASGELWRAVSVSTDVDAKGPIPSFPHA
ncbi:MAG: rmlD substrate binding domain protein [Rhizobacter sp.]|nr:rmlD substrate binding domain protein [Rhizobacter sp.]